MLPQLVNTGFQVLFHSPPGVLFTSPSRYCFTIGHQVVFSLGRWSSLLPTRFHVSRGTLDPAACNQISRTGLYPLWLAFPKPFCYPLTMTYAVRTPDCTQSGLGSFPFARRYLGNHFCFLFLRLLRCFSSPGSLYMAMYSPYSDRSFSCRVSPFRNLRVNGYLLLTVAYRSLSRLSSALSAKASTLRSYSLDLLFQCISDNTPARFLRDECMITK